jgi:transcriptional regulator with XRE-family HTH domain
VTGHSPGSAALRIRLGTRLRRLREARGVTAQDAAKAIRGSESKISRIELGRHAVREVDVDDLLTLYGVTDPAEREALLALAGQASAPAWWRAHSDILPAWFQTYLGLEEAADVVQSYDAHFLPSLLQSADYAAGLLALGGVAAPERDRLMDVRAERLRRFAAQGWRLTAVIDESVLHRPVSSQQVLRAQLVHLADASHHPGIAVRIRPMSAGPPAAPVGFTILRFADPELPDVVYTEQLTSASYLDRPADVSRYAMALDQMTSGSQPAEKTADTITALLRRLS